jgi:hypothetical protein
MISISLLPMKSGQALAAGFNLTPPSLPDNIKQTSQALAADFKLTAPGLTDDQTKQSGAGIAEKLGIRDLLPTARDGPSWSLNENDPKDDHNFSFKSLKHIDLHQDGTDGSKVWKMDAKTGTHKHGVRIHVDAPKGKWKNEEMSGYFKMLKGNDQFTMIARHGPSYHDNGGCDAYGYYGMLSANGDAYFKKKTYHFGGGYSDRTAVKKHVVDDIKGRWIGMKFLTYDLPGGKVKLELWVDDGDETNHWKKATEYVDDGNWDTHSSHCDRPKDWVIKDGTRSTFRVDNSEFDFKKLQVREITP